MELFKEIVLTESAKTAAQELQNSVDVINKLYNEWKKVKRRINAVDIVSTTANKLNNISPATVDRIHEASRLKLATLIMRCMDSPYWKPLSEKSQVYKKLYPLIEKLKRYDVRTGTGGTLSEVIATRLSAAYCFQNRLENGAIVFVSYEPKIPKKYSDYLFGSEEVAVVYKMQILNLPGDYASLVELLALNHEKAVSRYKKEQR